MSAGRGLPLSVRPRLRASDSVPNAVWIWDVQKLRPFVVLEHLSPVRSFQWDPQQPRLAICTGGGRLYLWSPAGCAAVQVPGEGEHGGAGGAVGAPATCRGHDLADKPLPADPDRRLVGATASGLQSVALGTAGDTAGQSPASHPGGVPL